jgi:hypothetical protein
MRRFRAYETFCAASLLALTVSQTARCGDGASTDLHLPRQDLAASLLAVGKQTNTEILFRPEDLRGATAPALEGNYSAQDAVRALVKGTGLAIEIRGESIFLRGRALAQGEGRQEGETLPETQITVTGSRIRGAPVASPVIVLDHQAMEERGQTSLGDVLRGLPQSFGEGRTRVLPPPYRQPAGSMLRAPRQPICAVWAVTRRSPCSTGTVSPTMPRVRGSICPPFHSSWWTGSRWSLTGLPRSTVRMPWRASSM